MIEKLTDGTGLTLGYIIKGVQNPDKTTFVTPSELPFQLGFVVYKGGTEIPRHVHHPVPRSLTRTSEALLVRKGRCEVDIFDDRKTLVATRELSQGDILMTVAGGHGFRVKEDLVLLEIKQGPYGGMDEKERF